MIAGMTAIALITVVAVIAVADSVHCSKNEVGITPASILGEITVRPTIAGASPVNFKNTYLSQQQTACARARCPRSAHRTAS